MTTINMFKNHPNRSKIKFIVLPLIREVFFANGDIAMDHRKLIEKYGHGSELTHGIEFDFSALLNCEEPHIW